MSQLGQERIKLDSTRLETFNPSADQVTEKNIPSPTNNVTSPLVMSRQISPKFQISSQFQIKFPEIEKPNPV